MSFVDRAQAEFAGGRLDRRTGVYLCSERDLVSDAWPPIRRSRERRNQREHGQYTMRELACPTGLNQTWSGDLHGELFLPTKLDVLVYLGVERDSFRSYEVLGWMVEDREKSALAGRLIEATCHKQCGPAPGAHRCTGDRGEPIDEPVHSAQLLSRPRRDPFTEPPSGVRRQPLAPRPSSQTLKLRPRFRRSLPGAWSGAIAVCGTIVRLGVNTEHRHLGIAMLTPDDVHRSRTQIVLESAKSDPSSAAWTCHPERFVRTDAHNRIHVP